MRSTGKQDLVNIYAQSISIQEQECSLYDLNFDNSVDVLDIVITVSIVLGNLDPNNDQQCAADINQDGIVNVLDIVQIVSFIVGS